MKWTTRKPKKPGYYWVTHEDDDSPALVQVGERGLQFIGLVGYMPISDPVLTHTRWAGPIEPPPATRVAEVARYYRIREGKD